MMFDKLRQTDGSVLFIVLILMMLLTLVLTMSADRATVDAELTWQQVNSEKAFYAADAGIKHAMVMLDDSLSWRDGLTNENLDGAVYSVAVVDSSTRPGLDDTLVLLSTAIALGAVGNVEAMVVPEYERLFKYAAFGDDSVILKNTGCTDSYSSDSGSYDDTQLYTRGDVGTNGLIEMSNTADIYGDASAATGGEITVDNSAAITGDSASSAPEWDMSLIPDTEFDWAKSQSTVPVGLSGNFSYNPATGALAVNNQYDEVVLSSGVYYFSSITLNQQASIKVAPGAEVTIYMSGDLNLAQGSAVNPGGSPTDLLFYSQGSQLSIGEHTEFRAAFWGPNADISVEQNTDVYGSLVGASIQILNSACIHYDRSLQTLTRGNPTGVVIVAWRES